MDMSSPLENIYPETEPDPEPVFAQPGPVPAIDTSTGPLSASDRDYIPPEQVEEGELSDPDDQLDPDAGGVDRTWSEDQSYRETV